MTRRLLTLFLLFASIHQIKAICLPGWRYNRSVTVTNTNPSAYTNQPVKVILNTQALITAGKMLANGNDIRFTDGSCNVLHYWIDSNLNTTTTVIWVKVPNIPSNASTTITLYYGNYCATAYQNGDSTFQLFDDFSGGSLNTSKWTAYQTAPGSATVGQAGGQINLTAAIGTDNIIRSNTAFTSPLILETKVTANNGYYPSIAILNTGTFGGVTSYMGTVPNNFNTFTATASGASYGSGANNSGTARSNGFWKLQWPATNNATATFPSGATHNIVATPALAGANHIAFGLLNVSVGSMSVDWIRARMYVPNEFASAVNTENSQSMAVSFTPTAICPAQVLTINFSKLGVYFGAGNTFKIELSDSNGLFGTPYTLATIIDTVLSTQNIELPANLLPGTRYKVRVTSTNPSFTCFVSDLSLTVYPKPTVSYTFPNDSQCYKYHRYTFTSTSTISSGSITTYIWNWDDFTNKDTLTTPTISHRFNPYYIYYYPKLTAISNNGCRDSASRQVNIKETPDIKTIFNDTIQCYKGNFYIIQSATVSTTSSITFKSFDFGDGSPVVNNVDSLTHQYASNGIYQVRQINWLANGCRDTNYLACLVNEHPNAAIVTNDTDQCLNGNDFIFEANSTINNGLPLLNFWDLTGGQTRDQQDSAHTSYSTASSRQIQLITISDDGVDGCSDTAFQTILVNPMPKAVMNILDNDQCFKYNKFTYVAKSTIAYGTISHSWDFGDLATATNRDTAIHSYAADGNFTIKVLATSNKGCTDSTSATVDVRPTPVPVINIPNPTQCYKYHELKAYSNSTISSGTFSKLWLISDGTDFTDVDSIAHKFGTYGDYGLQLILKSNYNCSDTISDSLHLLPVPSSSVSVDNSDQCFEGNNFTFTDNSTFGQGIITGNEWLFDDGTSDFNKSNVSHSYAAESAYKPGLIVFADNGCFDTSFIDIKVYPHPGSDFFINDTGQCVNNNNFVFSNNTFISEGAFTNRWFYGDGSAFQDVLNGSKKYTKDSTYVVRVISFSDQGCTDTATKTVTVFPKAKTGFNIDNPQQCFLGNNFNFTSTTTIKRGTYVTNWQFGDGSFLNNSPTASHSYIGVQQYNVRLISQTNEGCMDTLTKQVRTLPMPNADFTFNYDKKCLLGNDFQFSANSTVSNNTPMNHNWYFGDGDSAINFAVTGNQYANPGQYTVRLISSTNIGGCKDTVEKMMEVYHMPVASYLIDRNRQCFLNNNFNFTSTSNIGGGTIDNYDWTMGDNTSLTDQNPSKSYNTVDSFWVTLKVTSNYGCTDTQRHRVYVYPMPVAKFTVGPLIDRCLLGNIFKISNKSTISNNGVISNYSYYYDYPNPNSDSSNLATPLDYSYAQSGQYTIMQRVVSNRGCWDTATATVTVNPNPDLSFTVDSVCLKDSSRFINTTTIASGTIQSWKWLFGDGRVSTLQFPAHKYRNVGNFDVTLVAVTDKLCRDTLVIPGIAKVNPNPTAAFSYVKERSWENEVDIQYIDNSIGATSWYWNFSSMGTSTEQNPKLYYIDTLTQITTLIVRNDYGCYDTLTKSLFISPDVVYYMPSAFTPNDDNINETFKPIGLAYALDYKFIVFNRWGDILFKTDNPQQGWDGKYMGELVEQGVYFYRLEFVGSDELRHEESGNIVILR